MAEQQGEGQNQLIASNDDMIMKQIVVTLDDHNCHKVDVITHLQLINEILPHFISLKRSNIHDPQVWSQLMESMDEKIQYFAFIGMLEALADSIHKICCELSCMCSRGADTHSVVEALFSNTLSKFSWDAKVVVALAAFSVIYAEFRLVVDLYGTHPLANSISLLKRLPNIFDHSKKLSPNFEALWGVIKAMLDVAKCIIQFKELPRQYISLKEPPMSVAAIHITTTVYWTIKSVVVCVFQIYSFFGLGNECILSVTEEVNLKLSNLEQKLKNLHDNLTEQLKLCNQHIDEKKQVEAYNTLANILKTGVNDTMEFLKALIDTKDDLQPLLDCSTMTKVGLKALACRGWDYIPILILNLNLDISLEELEIMKRILYHYSDRYYHDRLLWIPMVVDRTFPWTESMHKKFEILKENMPWGYLVHHPSLIRPGVVRYIKEIWHFNKKPILIQLDSNGFVDDTGILYMIWIWGWGAYPFSRSREEDLWEEETWRLDLLVTRRSKGMFVGLVDGIDEGNMLNWIREEKVICLYGGQKIKWIKKFTNTAKEVAQVAGISLELMYVGMRNPKERVRNNINIITTENLSYCWKKPKLIWFFWTRLESMWYSKMKLGKTIENDPIMKGVMTMLIYGGNKQGWALISKGSKILAIAKGDIIMNCFQKYTTKENIEAKGGFIEAFNDHIEEMRLQTPHRCARFNLPEINGIIPPEVVACIDCGRIMEKSVSVMYNCYDN